MISSNRYLYLAFKAKVFDLIDFFSSSDLPPFVMPDNPKIKLILGEIYDTSARTPLGCARLIQLLMGHLVIEMIRHDLFLKDLETKAAYLKDAKLISIFKYIKENLGSDL